MSDMASSRSAQAPKWIPSAHCSGERASLRLHQPNGLPRSDRVTLQIVQLDDVLIPSANDRSELSMTLDWNVQSDQCLFVSIS